MRPFAAGLLALAAALSGCAAPNHVPNVVGVVRDVDHGAQGTIYRLADGREILYPRNGNFVGGSEPKVDTLLIAGADPEAWVSWAALLGPDATTPADCYAIFGKATADADQVFQTVGDPRGDVVMVFPKAADWVDHGTEGPFNRLKGPYTCINPQGEAFARGL